MCPSREYHSNASSATAKAGQTTAAHSAQAGCNPAVAVRAAATHPEGAEGVVGAADQAATTVPKLDKLTAGAEVVVVQ
jgi:hypothetical protein